MQPVQFRPLIVRSIWGGTRLQRELGKRADGATDVAESWEICDLPGRQTLIDSGCHRGRTLHELLEEFPEELLGIHAGLTRFPLLIKFLDANQQLSVQVHPRRPPPLPDGSARRGKAEAWIVIDAAPESRIYVGLKPGVDESALQAAIKSSEVIHCLQALTPRPGDCFFVRPGTVHALGAGILVAEIQQPPDVITYRLFDWNRVDAQGRPRQLHLEQGMANVDYTCGPVAASPPLPLSERPLTEELINSEYFMVHRHCGPGCIDLPNDRRMHVLVVIQGSLCLSNGPHNLGLGQTVLIPAEREPFPLQLSNDAVVLDTFLPEDFRGH